MHLHKYFRASALALLVLRVFTDDHDFTLALDDLAFFTHLLNRRSDFHLCALLMRCGVFKSILSYLERHVMRPFVRSYGLISSVTLSARKDADEIHAQLAGDVSQDHMPAWDLYLERRVRQSFLYDSFYFNYVLL